MYPFPYLNQGPLAPVSIGRCGGFVLVLCAVADASTRRWIEGGCPEPIRGFFHWDGPILRGESEGDVFDVLVIDGFGTGAERRALLDGELEVSHDTAQRFSEAVERWVRLVHQRAPIAAFEGPGYAEEPGPWEAWSRQQLAATPVRGIAP